MPDETSPEIIINGKRYIRLYHFMPAKYLYDMLAKDEVKIAIPEECNDPLEFMPAGEMEEGDFSRSQGGFISFSAKFSSSLMWAHYADAHRGVCLEFTFPLNDGPSNLSHWKERSQELLGFEDRCAILRLPKLFLQQYEQVDALPEKYVAYLVEVAYQRDRPLRDTFAGGVGGFDGGVDDLYLSPEFYTKSEEWAYEEEWRLMVNPVRAMSTHDGCFYVKGLTPYISKIILGKRFPQSRNLAWSYIVHAWEANNAIADLNKDNNLKYPKLCRASYDNDKYKIIIG